MNARLEKKLRLFTIIVTTSMIGGAVYSFALGFTAPREIAAGMAYALLITAPFQAFRCSSWKGQCAWLGGLSFTGNLIMRSAICASIIVPILFFSVR